MGIAKDEFAATRIFTHDDLEKFSENEIWELLSVKNHLATGY
jgi:hypothetical protein